MGFGTGDDEKYKNEKTDGDWLNEDSLDGIDFNDETENTEINRRLEKGREVDNYLTENDQNDFWTEDKKELKRDKEISEKKTKVLAKDIEEVVEDGEAAKERGKTGLVSVSKENMDFLEAECALMDQEAEIEAFKKQGFEARAEQALALKNLNKDLEKLNQIHAVVRIGNKTAVLIEETNAKTGHITVAFQNASDFRLLYSNRLVPVGKSRISLANIWLQWAKRKQFDHVEFSPEGTTEGNYNLFRGFPITPKPGAKHENFKMFVSEVICSGNDVEFEFVWGWLSHLFQKPGEVPGTSLVLRGKQGIGKNFFVETIGTLIGQHYLQLHRAGQIVGQFNRHLVDLLLVFANESLWGGDKDGIGALKTMISDSDSVCEPKGVDIIRVKNYKRLIFASNESWAVPMDLDDRRFLVLDVSDGHKKDYPYFESLQNDLSAGGYEHLMHDLTTHDISSFNVREAPQSNTGFDIKLRSASKVALWWYETLVDGVVEDTVVLSPDNLIRVGKKEVHDSYLSFAKQHGERYLLTLSLFSKELKKICPIEIYRGTDTCRQFQIPSLIECRKAFEVAVDLVDHEWNEQ